MALWVNGLLLLAGLILGASWVETFTDWGPEIDASLAMKTAGAVGGVALAMFLGKDYSEKLIEILKGMLSSWATTLVVAALVLAAFGITLSARTAELQALSENTTFKVTWKGAAESIDVDGGKKKRAVRFTRPWDVLPVTASVVCRDERAGSIGRYWVWQVKAKELTPARQLIIQGGQVFKDIFSSGAIPPLDLMIYPDPASGQPGITVQKYLGQQIRLGDCICEKAGSDAACRPVKATAPLKKGVDPKVEFVCAQPTPCKFYASSNKRITVSPGGRMAARIDRKAGTEPTDGETWEVNLVLQP